MKTIPFAKTEIQTDNGFSQLRYSLLVETINSKNIMFESYGVRIDKDSDETDSVRHVSFTYSAAEKILQSLHRNRVTPACLREVLDVLLG